MEGNEVGVLKDLFLAHEGVLIKAGNGADDVGINNLHAESRSPLCKSPGDAAHADKTQRLAVKLNAFILLFIGGYQRSTQCFDKHFAADPFFRFQTYFCQKLKVLSATCHDSRLLILDEPTAGLDVIARDELLDILREYLEADESRSILISSHISGDLEGICDDLYMIHDGKIVLHEETDVLLDRYGILKMDESQYQTLDRQFILRSRRETYGYCCLTNQRTYYSEIFPKIAVEKAGIDEVITMMVKGEA